MHRLFTPPFPPPAGRRAGRRRLATLLVALLVTALGSCGDDEDQSRPIEILYFVQGPTGTEFELVEQGDNDGCLAEPRDAQGPPFPTGGFGLQSADASHQLEGPFRAPHYFILENERQPTRAVIRNLGDVPLTVLRLLGAPNSAESLLVPPGECRSFSTYGDEDERNGFNVPRQPDGSGGELIPPDPPDQFRVEVCSFAAGTQLPDGFRCTDLPPRGAALQRDVGAAFIGTIGDPTASFLTQCLQVDPNQQTRCRTPTTFFYHQPQDQISAVMTRFTDQDPSFLQVDLLRGEQLLDSNRGDGDVFVRDDI